MNTPKITVTGICHNITIAGPPGHRDTWATPHGGTLHAEESLLLGETLAHGPVSVKCDNAQWLEQLAAQALAGAAWLHAQEDAA
jgi:hypothetical protein